MTGYILDDLALSTGLTPAGSEHHRRELSRLLRAAIDGGPTLDVPALCLTEAFSTGLPILTSDATRYAGVPVDVLSL